MNDIFHGAEEGWMAMQIGFTVLLFVPLCIEQEVFGKEKLLNLSRIVLRAVGNSEGMIAGNIVFLDPLSDVVLYGLARLMTGKTIKMSNADGH